MRCPLSEHCLCDMCHGYDCGANERDNNPLSIYTDERLFNELIARGYQLTDREV